MLLRILLACALLIGGCAIGDGVDRRGTSVIESEMSENNQKNLLTVQPPPRISWSLERDNLIKRFKLQNDRTVLFYMYLFIEGVGNPIGYYQVNKVSSVNSQLTNPEQFIRQSVDIGYTLPSPAEDGSYGTNGDAVFGFTPEDIYIEHNLKYVVSTIPLTFNVAPPKIAMVSVEDVAKLKELMTKIHSSDGDTTHRK